MNLPLLRLRVELKLSRKLTGELWKEQLRQLRAKPKWDGRSSPETRTERLFARAKRRALLLAIPAGARITSLLLRLL